MKRGSLAPIIIACLLALPCLVVLYVLSVGPACYLMVHGYLGDETYAFVYRPLFFIAERFTPLGSFLIDWIDAWAPFSADLPREP